MPAALSDSISILSAVDGTLPDPPTSWAYVGHWAGLERELLQFDLEAWSDTAATAITDLELVGAVGKPVTLADDDVDVVDTTDNELDLTAHAYQTGDGPVQLTTSGTLPGGLALATDYWIKKIGANSISLYESLEDLLDGGAEVDITSAGSGTHTVVDTADTERLHWMSYGLLGYDGDGVVNLSTTTGYAARVNHRPRTLAYGLLGATTEPLSAAINLVKQR